MSSVAEPPEAMPVTAGSGRLAETLPVVEPEGQFWPLAEPFAGWMCLAECASDIAPGIGDVMRSAGLLVQAAIESQARDLGRELTEILTGAGAVYSEAGEMGRPGQAGGSPRLCIGWWRRDACRCHLSWRPGISRTASAISTAPSIGRSPSRAGR